MELADTFRVAAPSHRVWALLWDLPRLAACVPGCEEIVALDESRFRARVKQSVGPFQLAMDLSLSIQEVTPERRMVVVGGGADRRGNRLTVHQASLEVEPLSPEETQVSYQVDLTLFGKLATLGYPVVKRKTQEMQTEFTRRIIAALASAP